QVDVLADELHRSVGHCKLSASRVMAAEEHRHHRVVDLLICVWGAGISQVVGLAPVDGETGAGNVSGLVIRRTADVVGTGPAVREFQTVVDLLADDDHIRRAVDAISNAVARIYAQQAVLELGLPAAWYVLGAIAGLRGRRPSRGRQAAAHAP